MKLTEYLKELDSHELYEPTGLAAALKEKTGIVGTVLAGDRGRGVLELVIGDRKVNVHVRKLALVPTAEATGNPKAAYLKPGVNLDEYSIAGFELTADLRAQLLGTASDRLGRGFRFRDDIAALEEAGF